MSCGHLLRLVSRRHLLSSSSVNLLKRLDSTASTPSEQETLGSPKGGFAKAFIKHSNLGEEPEEEEVPFETLLRNSKFIDLGDPEGRIVNGTIFHVVNNDLYIDFGWKFHCVCPRPSKNGSSFVRGAKVRLRVKDLELSTKFLGSDKDLTLLEADAQLLGLVYTPQKPK